ncbi:Csu type fimbrial protein [Ottowia thiooxydans]|uniref:Csu type fimbrial protein n=1 Tax=Ottowia thiooxydans TaxID=219182 RepID=UPI000424A254|nr:spore coat U domain-containing protein [Ottowia thiooxydans]
MSLKICRWSWRSWLLLCLMMSASVAAQAQSCWETGGNLNMAFGSVNVGGTADTTSTASFTCQSNSAVAYVRACLYVSEGPGGGSDMSGVNPRKMTNYNAGALAYTLYSDASRTQVLGPQGASYAVYEKTLTIPGGWNTAQLDFSVFGRIGTLPLSTAAGSYQAQFSGATLVYSMAGNAMPASCIQSGYGTANKYFQTSVSVSNSCAVSVSATPLDFGTATSLTTQVDSVSTIAMTCPPNTSWTLGLNYGVNAAGTQRRMVNAGAYVNYGLFRDSNRTLPWDNSSNVMTGSGSSPSSVTVYGRVPAQPSVSPGSYSDTVTVTLTY